MSKRKQQDKFDRMAERLCTQLFTPTEHNIVRCGCIPIAATLRRVDRAGFERGYKEGYDLRDMEQGEIEDDYHDRQT